MTTRRGSSTLTSVLCFCGLSGVLPLAPTSPAAAQSRQGDRPHARRGLASPEYPNDLHYPQALNAKIDILAEEAKKEAKASGGDPWDTKLGKKEALLIRARDHLANDLSLKVDSSAHILSNEGDFKQSPTDFPKYFGDKFLNHTSIQV